jgi:aspartokinase/homoserine dehydrogenase 1
LAAIAGEQIEILLCQASSQYELCLAVRSGAVERVIQGLTCEFDQHPVQIETSAEVAIITVLGHQLHLTPGVAGRVFAAVAREGINVIAIGQRASDSNLTLVVEPHNVVAAINVLHHEFKLEPTHQAA